MFVEFVNYIRNFVLIVNLFSKKKNEVRTIVNLFWC